MEAPKDDTMERDALFALDPLGYARVTAMQANGWRAKTLSTCMCARNCGVCLLDKLLPEIATADPMILTPLNDGWKALKDVDEAVSNFLPEPLLATLGNWTDASFKCCLCIPFIPVAPMTLMYEGQNEHILEEPKTAMEMLTGPKLNVKETLFIEDNRSCCARFMGSKKGRWKIIKDGKVIAKVYKKKKCCQCASFYTMFDADEVPIARMQVSPTCAQCCNDTCRKFTCQCCCLCVLCDCLRCKCIRPAKPYAKVMTPTRKEKVDVYNKGKCCKAPKTKVMYRTLYIPGQDGETEEDEVEDAVDEDDEAEDGEDEMEEASATHAKYNKQTKGPNKGEPGLKQKYYTKGPKFCCVGLVRQLKKGAMMPDLGDFDFPDMGELGDVAGDMAASVGDVELADVDPEAANAADLKGMAKAGGKLAKGLKDDLETAGGKGYYLQNYKLNKDERMDLQYAENFTTSQKAGALLFALWEMRGLQY